MFIKIAKASKDSYWYASEVGKDSSFEVVGVDNDTYHVRIPKWSAESFFACDIAPVLKEDAEEILKYSKPTPTSGRRESNDWRMKHSNIDREAKSVERSRFNTQREVALYEELNAASPVQKYSLVPKEDSE